MSASAAVFAKAAMPAAMSAAVKPASASTPVYLYVSPSRCAAALHLARE
jgi:hypothetical protein